MRDRTQDMVEETTGRTGFSSFPSLPVRPCATCGPRVVSLPIPRYLPGVRGEAASRALGPCQAHSRGAMTPTPSSAGSLGTSDGRGVSAPGEPTPHGHLRETGEKQKRSRERGDRTQSAGHARVSEEEWARPATGQGEARTRGRQVKAAARLGPAGGRNPTPGRRHRPSNFPE